MSTSCKCGVWSVNVCKVESFNSARSPSSRARKRSTCNVRELASHAARISLVFVSFAPNLSTCRLLQRRAIIEATG